MINTKVIPNWIDNLEERAGSHSYNIRFSENGKIQEKERTKERKKDEENINICGQAYRSDHWLGKCVRLIRSSSQSENEFSVLW